MSATAYPAGLPRLGYIIKQRVNYTLFYAYFGKRVDFFLEYGIMNQ